MSGHHHQYERSLHRTNVRKFAILAAVSPCLICQNGYFSVFVLQIDPDQYARLRRGGVRRPNGREGKIFAGLGTQAYKLAILAANVICCRLLFARIAPAVGIDVRPQLVARYAS